MHRREHWGPLSAPHQGQRGSHRLRMRSRGHRSPTIRPRPGTARVPPPGPRSRPTPTSRSLPGPGPLSRAPRTTLHHPRHGPLGTARTAAAPPGARPAPPAPSSTDRGLRGSGAQPSHPCQGGGRASPLPCEMRRVRAASGCETPGTRGRAEAAEADAQERGERCAAGGERAARGRRGSGRGSKAGPSSSSPASSSSLLAVLPPPVFSPPSFLLLLRRHRPPHRPPCCRCARARLAGRRAGQVAVLRDPGRWGGGG